MKQTSAVAVVAFFLSTAVHAATQGELSATASQASFSLTANGPALPRLVQVLNVTDVVLDNNTRSNIDATRPGATMNFCVVDTYGAQVGLSVSTANPAPNTSAWQMKTNNNETVNYWIAIEDSGGTTIVNNSDGTTNGQSSIVGVVPASVVVTSSTSCGTGNVRAQVRLPTPMPQTLPARSYTDSITLIATPQ